MDDPLTRAFDDAPRGLGEDRHRDVSHHRSEDAPPLGQVLESLRVQLIEAMALPFFDAGATLETTPVTKVGHSETGAVAIVARKHEPAYEVKVSVEIRCDHENLGEHVPDAGGYEVRVRAHLRCADQSRISERDLVVLVHEIEGRLELDAPRLRDEMAAAIRAIGKVL